MSEEMILRDAVIGFIVTEARPARSHSAGPLITVRPISMNFEGYTDDDELELAGPDRMWEQERVVGVIAAPPGAYRVLGVIGDQWKELGYEFPGADHPDWEEVRQETARISKGGKPGEAQD